MKLPRWNPILALLLPLLGCGGLFEPAADAPDELTLTTAPGPFEILVEAEGQLRAVRSTPITVPPAIRGSISVAWIEEAGTTVSAGDPVIRFMADVLFEQEASAQRKVELMDFRIRQEQGEQALGKNSLEVMSRQAEAEVAQKSRFALRNERLFSREEIIESQTDLELAAFKRKLFETRLERQDAKSGNELGLLELERKGQVQVLERSRDQLNFLEVRAPHDGCLQLHPFMAAEGSLVGKMVFPGMPLAELPDLSEMEARVFVLESEAAGLTAGLPAEVELGAAPGRWFKATVKQVAPLAKSIDRRSPIKYFETVLSLEETVPELMRSGCQARARITIARAQDVIAVPNQALFYESDATWVFVEEDGRFTRRMVRVGAHSLTRSVIEEGLSVGEKIAMAYPREVAE